MSLGFSLLDLMNVPPLPSRIMRLLLRHQHLGEDQMWQAIQAQQRSDELDHNAFKTALTDLLVRGWLVIQEANGIANYRIILRHSEIRIHDSDLVRRANLDNFEDSNHYVVNLEMDGTSKPTTETRRSSGLDGLDTLLQRGGKKTLPKSIWDKLDGGGSAGTESSPAPARRRGSLLDDLNASSETSSTDTPVPPDDQPPPAKPRGKDLLNLF